MKPLLTREGAKMLQKREQHQRVNVNRTRLESGVGRCPWKIVVTLMVATKNVRLARKLLPALFTRWPSPESLANAERGGLEMLLSPVTDGHRRARLVREFTAAWVRDDWQTVLDLPGVGVEALRAIETHAMRLKRETV